MRVSISTFRNICILFLFFMNCFRVSGFAQEQYPTNSDLIRFAADSIVSEIINIIHPKSQQILTFVLQKERDDRTEFIVASISEAFQNRGQPIKFFSDSSNSGFSVFLIVSDARIQYLSVKRNWFLGKRTLERQATLSVIIRVVKNENSLLIWSGKIEKTVNGELPFSRLLLVESGEEFLGKPLLPSKRGLSRWIEPCIVMATVGSLGYLIYSVRSQ